MSDDDEAARKARAEELRKRISGLKDQPADAGTENDAGISPRDFIHEKMHELDDKDK